MRESNRLKRARLRDRRRGHEDMEAPALFRPMTGFDLYLVNEYARAAARTILFVSDPVYRGKHLLAVEQRLMGVYGARGPSAMARACLPARHRVAIEGRRDPDGKMMFLLSDPGRPSQVYARVMADREQDESPPS